MPSQNQRKLELLVRQNKGRVDHGYYVTELSHILRTQVNPTDILDLQQTDAIFAIHKSESLKSNSETGFAFKKLWHREPVSMWLNFCHCLGDQLTNESAVLFAGPYHFCGGVKINPTFALKAVVALLEFDRNTLRLQSLSSTSGLYLDLFEQESTWLIEMVVWGLWKFSAETCVATEP